MRPVLSSLVFLVAATLALHAEEPAEETHACADPSGEIVLQNDPCDVAPPKHAAKKAAAPRSEKHAASPASRPKPLPPAPAFAPAPASTRRGSSSFVSRPIRPVIDPSVFTSDPRWGSPERTLKTFVGAMRGGDRALARACLAAGTPDDLDRMSANVQTFSGYVLEGEVGPYWSIRALRPKTRPKWIFFTRAGDGTWRIAAL